MQAAPDARRWKALALLCASFFMVILDSAIVIVALPSIESDLGFASADLQWILSAYALTFGGLLLLGGRAADLLGRRRVFMLGLGFFTAASVLCAFAWSPGALIAARAIQGVGAAIMTPTALSIVMTTFEEGAERNKALGIWGSLGGIGGTAGWLIGGPLTDVGWEWIFLINLPVGAVSLFLAPRLLRESRAEGLRSGYDPLGAISVTAALVLAVCAVVEAPDVGWGDAQTIALFAGSAALFALFAAIESRVVSPLLPLRILRSRTLVGANLGMFLFSAIAFAAPFVLTLYVQQVLGYSPVEFGLTSIVFPLAAAAAAMTGQGLVLKLGFRPLAAAGLVMLGIGGLYWGQASPGGSYFGDVFLGLLVSGAGTGLTFVTCSIAALAGVEEREAGVASGLSNTTFQLGGAVGTAIVSTVVVSRTDEVAGGAIPGLTALTEGFQAGFLACIVFAALGLVAVLTLLGRRAGKEPAAPEEALAEAASAGGGP